VRELAVAVRNVRRLGAQLLDDVAQRRQALVDVPRLRHAHPLGLRQLHPLGARQIHEVQLAQQPAPVRPRPAAADRAHAALAPLAPCCGRAATPTPSGTRPPEQQLAAQRQDEV
jgi:hypothetical protein